MLNTYEGKKFKGKKITIKFLGEGDIKKAEKFKKFINELAEDKTAYISTKSKKTLKEEREWLKDKLKKIKKQQAVFLVAETNNKVVGTTSIALMPDVQNHVGSLGISILKDYRGIGLGKYLMKEILKLAKNKLKPRPKMIRLSVFSRNKIAILLYKKMGFKIVAKIPKQFNFNGKLLDEIIMILKL